MGRRQNVKFPTGLLRQLYTKVLGTGIPSEDRYHCQHGKWLLSWPHDPLPLYFLPTIFPASTWGSTLLPLSHVPGLLLSCGTDWLEHMVSTCVPSLRIYWKKDETHARLGLWRINLIVNQVSGFIFCDKYGLSTMNQLTQWLNGENVSKLKLAEIHLIFI